MDESSKRKHTNVDDHTKKMEVDDKQIRSSDNGAVEKVNTASSTPQKSSR